MKCLGTLHPGLSSCCVRHIRWTQGFCQKRPLPATLLSRKPLQNVVRNDSAGNPRHKIHLQAGSALPKPGPVTLVSYFTFPTGVSVQNPPRSAISDLSPLPPWGGGRCLRVPKRACAPRGHMRGKAGRAARVRAASARRPIGRRRRGSGTRNRSSRGWEGTGRRPVLRVGPMGP